MPIRFRIFATTFIAGAILPLSAQATKVRVNLAKIGHIEPKGRVQDLEYNPHLPVVEELIKAGPASIPFLISKLADETPIRGEVMDFWPSVCVGDVAWFILCDFFTTSDWQASTITPSLPSIFGAKKSETPAWEYWADQVNGLGRQGIRQKVEAALKPYLNSIQWDPSERCFRPMPR